MRGGVNVVLAVEDYLVNTLKVLTQNTKKLLAPDPKRPKNDLRALHAAPQTRTMYESIVMLLRDVVESVRKQDGREKRDDPKKLGWP